MGYRWDKLIRRSRVHKINCTIYNSKWPVPYNTIGVLPDRFPYIYCYGNYKIRGEFIVGFFFLFPVLPFLRSLTGSLTSSVPRVRHDNGDL